MKEELFKSIVNEVYKNCGQLLENYFKMAGYKNFIKVVDHFCKDEDYQVPEVYFSFIEDNEKVSFNYIIEVHSFNFEDELYPAIDFFTLLLRLSEELHKVTNDKEFLVCIKKVNEKLESLKK